MKVIKPGKLKQFTKPCPHCEAVLEFNNSEMLTYSKRGSADLYEFKCGFCSKTFGLLDHYWLDAELALVDKGVECVWHRALNRDRIEE